MSLRQHSRMKIDTMKLASRGLDEDFRKLVMKQLGDISDEELEIYGSRVAVATYLAPERTAGGVYLPQKSVDEDLYQGKIGVLIKVGNTAFKYDGVGHWNEKDGAPGRAPKIGDYVVFSPHSGIRNMGIRGNHCRIMFDKDIEGRVGDPAIIY